jgi:lipoprotein-releasing system permease protein
MYKFLLCWRYLRTRYIALASIISVTLGVATMIVVNAVMSGFSCEMQNRIHGILSDLVFESHGIDGFPDPQWHIDQIQQAAGQWIEGMTPTVNVPGLINFSVRGRSVTRQVMIIGIDENTHATVSDFSKYLQHPANRKRLSFDLREDNYDVRDHQLENAPLRSDMEKAGWPWRRLMAEQQKRWEETRSRVPAPSEAAEVTATSSADPINADPFAERETGPVRTFNPATEQHPGAVLGIALASVRDSQGMDHFLVRPGDDVVLMCPTAGTPPKEAHDSFTVVDFYESKMSEYDSTFVFVPMREVQHMRGLRVHGAESGNITSIQIKLKPGVDGDMVRDVLRSKFPPEIYGIYTWRDKQGPLLAAVQMERAVLNILLFMIIAVAGFGILAIFFMIVVEKTRDVGILKSLGASSRGVMGIFLSYGLSLGMVGAGAGLAIGLLFVRYINQIRGAVEWLTGQQVFDPSIYYFYQIPTIIEPFTVAWIVGGALLIAVLASILPAMRAARLHPVEALRYE